MIQSSNYTIFKTASYEDTAVEYTLLSVYDAFLDTLQGNTRIMQSTLRYRRRSSDPRAGRVAPFNRSLSFVRCHNRNCLKGYHAMSFSHYITTHKYEEGQFTGDNFYAKSFRRCFCCSALISILSEFFSLQWTLFQTRRRTRDVSGSLIANEKLNKRLKRPGNWYVKKAFV